MSDQDDTARRAPLGDEQKAAIRAEYDAIESPCEHRAAKACPSCYLERGYRAADHIPALLDEIREKDFQLNRQATYIDDDGRAYKALGRRATRLEIALAEARGQQALDRPLPEAQS